MYQKSLDINVALNDSIIKDNIAGRLVNDQLPRASLSISLNIAKGTSRYSKPERKHFYSISRGSLFESIAILDILERNKILDKPTYLNLAIIGEEISKMLFALESLLK